MAHERASVGEDVAVHATPLIALGIVFVVFLALRTWGGVDGLYGIRRGFAQWGAFVLAPARVGRRPSGLWRLILQPSAQ